MTNSGKNETTKNAAIMRLILNTRKLKRPNNLVEIASDVDYLKQEFGSLKAISDTIGVSAGMLQQFLSVKQLSPEVKKLVAERKIDSVTIVHQIRNLDAETQKEIAKEVIEKGLSSGDVRAFVVLRKSLPNLSIRQLIAKIQNSKNVKVYVAYFKIPYELKKVDELKMSFEKIIGKEEIVSLNIDNHVGTLEVTKYGLKKLREAASENKLTLRKLIDNIVMTNEI